MTASVVNDLLDAARSIAVPRTEKHVSGFMTRTRPWLDAFNGHHKASGPALSPSSLVGTPTLSSMLSSRFPIGVGSAYLM